MEERIREALIGIVGEENYTEELIDLIAYASDASEHKSRPVAGLTPTTTEQVSEIMKLATAEKLVVVPRGAGTGLAGLAVAEKGGIVLDLGRMNKILKISIEDRLAVVQPGVVYASLESALAADGFFFPPDPASGKVSTLGGNVATNAGGVKGAKYGVTKDYVLALEVVLPDGRILKTGSNCMKSVSGYDLTRLFVGSEGTLGVITEITLKINPKPPLTATALATFDDLEDAGKAICEIMYSGVLPSVLEIIDAQTIIAINQDTDLDLPVVEAILLAETDGNTAEETEFQMTKVIRVFEKNNATQVQRAKDEAEAGALWAARKSAYAVAARVNNNLVIEDITVPMSRVAEMLQEVDRLAKEYDLKILSFGHAGDGNLHPTITFDGTDPEMVERVEAVSAKIFEKAIELGGTLTGEHGIGLAKAPFMNLEHSEVAMEVMRSTKRMFDPLNILNPGKMALEN